MAFSGEEALIDFNSPERGCVEFHTPLVPIPKTLLENNELVASAGENPFDFVVEQINNDNGDDPFELVFQEARQSNQRNAVNGPTSCPNLNSAESVKANRECGGNIDSGIGASVDLSHEVKPNVDVEHPAVVSVGKVSDIADDLNIEEIRKRLSSKSFQSECRKEYLKNVTPCLLFMEKKLSVLDESASCLDNISDSILNVSILSSGQIDDKLGDSYVMDEERRVGEKVEEELNRTIELMGDQAVCLEEPLNSVAHRSPCTNSVGRLQTPIRGNVKAVIADRINKCIQRGLNDSRTKLADTKHNRSFSSPLIEYDNNVSLLAAVSCATGLNFKRGAVSSFELFESPLLVKNCTRSIDLYQAVEKKNSSFSGLDAKLLDKFNALKNGLGKNNESAPGSKLCRSFSEVSQQIMVHNNRDVVKEDLNLIGSNLYETKMHKRHRSLILKRDSFSDFDCLENTLLQLKRSSSEHMKNKGSNSCLFSNRFSCSSGPNGKMPMPSKIWGTHDTENGFASFINEDELNDSVFLEAKSLSCLFKHKAASFDAGEQGNSSDEEDNFLCGRLDIPSLCSTTSDSSEVDEPKTYFGGLQEMSALGDKMTNHFSDKLVGNASYSAAVSAEGSSDDNQKVLSYSKSDSSSSAVAKVTSVPELSQEKIQKLPLKTQSGHGSKKIQLPVLVPPPPVPIVGTRNVSDKRLKPLKPQANTEPVRRGPMKAVIPVGNMMRNPGKKVSQPGGRDPSSKSNLVKSRISMSGVKLMPMAQSTPDVNRKGTSILQALKMCSPIPHDKTDEIPSSKRTSSGIPKPGLKAAVSLQDVNGIPSLTSPSVTLQSPQTKLSGAQERSRSVDYGVKITSPAMADFLQQVKDQRQLKSARNLPQINKPATLTQAALSKNNKNNSQQVSSPLKSLTKNCRTGKSVPSIKLGLQAPSHLKKGSVTTAEKENVRPVQRV
ncbi:uncharacterized protein [Anabrus simplex]|uniref:uncharacterized protein n=1 Tax=Anabrus simplex TaxID=316456 RepID=UPI0035A36BFC